MEAYSFRNDLVEIFTRQGILFVVFCKGARINAANAEIIVIERLKVANGRDFPTLADCRQGSNMDKGARTLFASKAAVTNVTAGGLLIDSAIHKMLINAYLLFDQPNVPNKVFTSEDKALNWLNLFKTNIN